MYLLYICLLYTSNALIYAGIWPLSIHGLGKFTKTGSSLLIMGLCGNAILPLIYGHLADMYSLRFGYWVLIPCFLYLVFFAVKGHKIDSWKSVSYTHLNPLQARLGSKITEMKERLN